MTSPTEYLNAAKSICNIAKGEPLHRAAINRLYYASYHQCVAYHAGLKYMGSPGKTNGRHERLIHELNNPSELLTPEKRFHSRALGKLLRELCQRRAVADYHPKTSVSETDMMLSMRDAEEIFKNT